MIFGWIHEDWFDVEIKINYVIQLVSLGWLYVPELKIVSAKHEQTLKKYICLAVNWVLEK